MKNDYDDPLNFLRTTTNRRVFLAILFGLLSVVMWGSVATGDLLNAPKGADFIVTPQGLTISSRTLSRQGASHLAGNFQGLAGKSMAEIIERVPSTWKMVPQDRGVGIKFLDELGKERVRIHAPSPRAPAGSNSASGWVLRIMDRAGNYYDDAGRIVPYRANEGHIPILGNPNWP